MVGHRLPRHRTGKKHLFAGDPKRHPGAGDRRGPGAAIGLDHIAVELDLMLAEGLKVGDRPQSPSDQPLDFQCPATLLAARGLAVGAAVRGTRQHAVFGCHPAPSAVAKKMRHAILNRRRAQHMRVAELCQTGSLGMQRHAWFKGDGAEICRRAAGGTCHEALLLLSGYSAGVPCIWRTVCSALTPPFAAEAPARALVH